MIPYQIMLGYIFDYKKNQNQKLSLPGTAFNDKFFYICLAIENHVK